MARFRGLKALAVSVGAVFVAVACGNQGGGGGGNVTLAKDQTLRLAIQDDVEYLDPGHVSSAVDIAFTNELFAGLYKFDNDLKVVPDMATGKPDISSDGLTYTFHLKKGIKFSNGDPVTSKDVLYSWNRTASLNDAYATVFDPVVGGTDTENGKTKTMEGLTAPDDSTVKAKLTDPAGYWLTELALWTASIVDQKAVAQGGEDKWWTNPATAIGAGPFKLTERTPKASMAFEPVANWWGGSTGALKKVTVEIGIDQASQVKKFESGGFDMLGFANNQPDPEDILRYKNDATKSKQLTTKPAARTTWAGFNFTKGPFAGLTEGLNMRKAFALAIERNQLVDVACAKGILCTAATGGQIAKGLKGYTGDNSDPYTKFDASQAKSLLSQAGGAAKVAGLKYSFNANSQNQKVAENLQSQWRNNLGVNVDLDSMDFPSLLKKRKAKETIVFRDSWGADYDHPQDWFDNLDTCAQAPPGKGNSEGYCNPKVDALVAKADKQQIEQALPDYVSAGKQMIQDVEGANLMYGTQTYFTKDYVKGSGFNALYDYRWEGISIAQH
jgi:oligopeptide transport system substrate-binding protein